MSRDPYVPPDRSSDTPAPAPLPVRPLREPALEDYLASARPYARRALLGVVLGTILATILAFVWPPSYRAQASLLPPTEEDTGFNAAAIFRGLNLPGIKIPSRAGPEDVTISVLKSRRVASALVDRFGLLGVYKLKSKEKAIARLQKNSSFKVDESGSVLLTVTDESPKRAADLANAYTEELDHFNREVRMTKGRRIRLFVERRMTETRKTLAAAEVALEEYGRKHKAVALSADQMSTVESAAELFARQSALQTRLGVVRQYAAENSDEVRQVSQELDQVNRQIARLPEVGMDLAKYLREVKIQEQVFALLSAQYEEARITEARDVTTVEVLDDAVPPERRAWPRRGLLIAFGAIASSFLALGWIAWNVRRYRSPASALP